MRTTDLLEVLPSPINFLIFLSSLSPVTSALLKPNYDPTSDGVGVPNVETLFLQQLDNFQLKYYLSRYFTMTDPEEAAFVKHRILLLPQAPYSIKRVERQHPVPTRGYLHGVKFCIETIFLILTSVRLINEHFNRKPILYPLTEEYINHEHPKLILLLLRKSKDPEDYVHFSGTYSSLAKILEQKLPYHSIVLAIHEHKLFICCIACHAQDESVLQEIPEDKASLDKISILRNMIHSNFHGMEVQITRAAWPNNCTNEYLDPDPIMCFEKNIHIHLNSTMTHVTVPTADIRMELVLAGYVFKHLAKYPNYDAFPHSFSFTPYTFIVINDREANDIQALTQPFQGEVWITIGIFNIVVPLSMTIFTITSTRSTATDESGNFLIRLWDMMFLHLAALLDQCDRAMSFKTGQTKWVWILWNFLSLIILNSYDGQLYSFMASHVQHPIPENLMELTFAGIPTFTMSSFFSRVGYMNLFRRSPIFGSHLKAAINGTEGKDYPSFYKKLNSSYTYYPVDYEAEYLNITMDIAQKKFPFGGNKTFAIIDQEDRVQLVRATLSQLPSKSISSEKVVDGFLKRSLILFKRNSLTFFVKKLYTSISEAGIVRRWERVWQGIKFKRVVQMVAKSNLTERRYELGSKGKVYVVNDVALATTNNVIPKPVPFELLKTVMLMCLVLISVGFLAFILEVMLSIYMT